MLLSTLSALAILMAPGRSVCSVVELRGSGAYRAERIEQFVDRASFIVRARVLADSPRDSVMVRGFAIHLLRFEVIERIRAPDSLTHVDLPGTLVANDDFNGGPVPYSIVRSAGQRGDCDAREYRAGGEYLFLLRPGPLGLTPHWKPLAPFNEQLRGADDPWLVWVRSAANRLAGSSTVPPRPKPAPRP